MSDRRQALEGGDDSDVVALPQGPSDATLWRQLLGAGEPQGFAAAFLALQAQQLPGVRSSAVFEITSGGLKPLALWPTNAAIADLESLAALALAEQRPVLRQAGRGSRLRRVIALPVEAGGKPVAIAVAALSVDDDAEAPARQMRQLQWSAAWLREYFQRGGDADLRGERDRSRATLELLATVVDRGDFRTAALAAVTEMALRFGCSRVSLGFVRWGRSRVAAISHTSTFSTRIQLVQQISGAMDEAIDQKSILRYPPAPEDVVFTTAHAALAAAHKGGNILTVPLLVVDAFAGAICFERPVEQPFDEETVRLLSVMAAALGPVLTEKRRNDRWLVVKAWDSLTQQLTKLLGPGHLGRKVVALLALIVVAILSFWTDTFHVVADAQLEPAERRSVVSAYDGYVQTASARAGDLVKAGEELASLEDRELSLERLRWVTERQQHQFEYDRALAAGQPANINIVKTQIEQADAQIRLIDEQIARTRLIAPFDGLVVRGDLSQRIGASVGRGETLFELSPLSGYRVVVTVGERDIGELTVGQPGEAVFASLPEEPIPIAIDRITPVAQEQAGGVGFRVEATISGDLSRLRPGMTGVARVAIDRRPVISIWLRPFLDWLGLVWWRLVP
ncbi:MAG TPA: efflux RND transporter periplasmic adaptor subunit [Devosia sp.]|jgi:RND family efflux transporter MFP subunit|uniref:efflux RND transporter periplasmic adaptor subunit n=1 Tax=Devosia sp. TaxID=1871048 RepID=UPI002DDDAD13|nr:efflux RND transporter periplasmic adaptor subunit [Devosia sp.]HEV2517588.1 efflux RND transporter periplasmic adaptor subunit [Devosia sp.]